MEFQTNRLLSPVQPRHLHLVEYRPSCFKQVDKQNLLNELLNNKWSFEFNYIIIAKEETFMNNINFEYRILVNLKKKYKTPQIHNLFMEAIQNAQSDQIINTNELTIKPVQTQNDAISSITKNDMNFVYTGTLLNPIHFNIKFKVYKWCINHSNFDLNSDIVKSFVNKNKKKIKIDYIIDTFNKARNEFLESNKTTEKNTVETYLESIDFNLLPNELIEDVSTENDLQLNSFWETINSLDFLDTELLENI